MNTTKSDIKKIVISLVLLFLIFSISIICLVFFTNIGTKLETDLTTPELNVGTILDPSLPFLQGDEFITFESSQPDYLHLPTPYQCETQESDVLIVRTYGDNGEYCYSEQHYIRAENERVVYSLTTATDQNSTISVTVPLRKSLSCSEYKRGKQEECIEAHDSWSLPSSLEILKIFLNLAPQPPQS